MPLLLQFLLTAGALMLTIFVATRFFRRKRAALVWMVNFYVVMLVIALVRVGTQSWLETTLLKSHLPESIVDLVQTLIWSAIWISYFRKSKRVKATFQTN